MLPMRSPVSRTAPCKDICKVCALPRNRQTVASLRGPHGIRPHSSSAPVGCMLKQNRMYRFAQSLQAALLRGLWRRTPIASRNAATSPRGLVFFDNVCCRTLGLPTLAQLTVSLAVPVTDRAIRARGLDENSSSRSAASRVWCCVIGVPFNAEPRSKLVTLCL